MTPSTRGRRAAAVPVDSPSTTPALRVEDIQVEVRRQAERASYVGRRRAPVPRSPEVSLHEAEIVSDARLQSVLAALQPVDQTTSLEYEDTARIQLIREAPEPVATTYVATSVAGEPRTAGKRRAVKHSGSRGPLFKGLPSTPLLLGVAALAVSIGGVVSVPDKAPVSAPSADLIHAASALSGSSATGTVVGGRDAVLSRDGAERAQAEAAGANPLQAQAEAQAKVRVGALGEITADADDRAKQIALNLWQYPLANVYLTARFGQYGLWSSYHTGLDFNGNNGDPISAIANGVVTSTGYDGSYGNKTVVTLEDGTEIWYCHQTSISVSVGDEVRGGELIGTVGSTGNVTGSHLHIEVRPGGGDPVDPYAAMQQHGLF